MPNIKSVKKDVIKSRKNHLRNISAKSAMKTFIKKAKVAIDGHSEVTATADAIRAALAAQLTGPVRWTESIKALQVRGATTFLEIGSKDVLTGLLKRIDRGATGIALNNAEAVAAWCQAAMGTSLT